jgi:hypothetical protein
MALSLIIFFWRVQFYENFGVSFGETWMDVDGWTDEGVKAVIFISYLTHNIGT